MSRIVAAALLLALTLPSFAHASGPRASTVVPNAPGRALVLEPFGTDLGFGPDAGSDVVSALTSAGFKVDVMRDDQVTVPVMQSMPQYSVIYLETHSQTVDNHGFVLTGDQDAADYGGMRRDCAASNPNFCALMQGFAGHDNKHLYNAITDRFIQNDLSGAFPNSSLIFINGCNLLQAPSFWTSLSARNSDVMVSWDDEVDSAITEQAAALFFKDLATGMSVKDAVAAVTAAGLGTSNFIDPFTGQTFLAHLGYFGDGADTLSNALSGAAPAVTATGTAVPTATPVPLTLNVKIGHTTITAGKKESIKITSLPGARVSLKISFPGGGWTYKKSTTLGATGVKTYSFTQPGLKKGAGNHLATVKVTASLNGQTKHSTKKYTLA